MFGSSSRDSVSGMEIAARYVAYMIERSGDNQILCESLLYNSCHDDEVLFHSVGKTFLL